MSAKPLPAIEVKNLTKRYAKTVALDEISFSIQKGEFFGLLGPNGAGKTTTINILTGLCNKTSGEAALFGKDVVSDYQDARSLIGLVPQEFNFDKFEKVYNILFFNAGYFGIPEKKRSKRIETVLKELGLWEKRFSKAIELSGGMKRKLMIARALIHQPRILILDEPTAGVDVETRKSMWKYISKLQSKGITILLTTHYIEEAEELCERIAIINNGEIIKLDSKRNLLNLLGQEKIVIQLKEPPQKIPSSLQKYHATLQHSHLTLSLSTKDSWETMLGEIQKVGLIIKGIRTTQPKLEDIFIHLTK